MKGIKYLALGVVFGIVLTKSEVISWYRIQEMFRFQSFHMYGIIMTAIGLGALIVYLIKKKEMKAMDGTPIELKDKNLSITRYLVGGTIFGLGWALTGACPGPIFALIGNGFYAFSIVLIGAVTGTFIYGLLRDKLPH